MLDQVELAKDIGKLGADVNNLVKLFDEVNIELKSIKPLLQDKINREDFDELREEFKKLSRIVDKLEYLIDSNIQRTKESDLDLKENKTKLSNLEFSVWKLGALSTSGGIIGSTIIATIQALYNIFK